MVTKKKKKSLTNEAEERVLETCRHKTSYSKGRKKTLLPDVSCTAVSMTYIIYNKLTRLNN